MWVTIAIGALCLIVGFLVAFKYLTGMMGKVIEDTMLGIFTELEKLDMQENDDDKS